MFCDLKMQYREDFLSFTLQHILSALNPEQKAENEKVKQRLMHNFCLELLFFPFNKKTERERERETLMDRSLIINMF